MISILKIMLNNFRNQIIKILIHYLTFIDKRQVIKQNRYFFLSGDPIPGNISYINVTFFKSNYQQIINQSNIMETPENQQQDQEVAGFVAKTYQILNSQEFQKIIFWSPNGNEFIIKDTNKFQQIVLPKYFRHRKLNSFIRQLNMYGFHKTRRQNTRSVFSHPHFIKNKQQLLPLVKRKLKMSDENCNQNQNTTITTPQESTKIISVKKITSKVFETLRTAEESTTFINTSISTKQLIKTNRKLTMNKLSFGNIEYNLQQFEDDNLDCVSIQDELEQIKNDFTKKINGICLINTAGFLNDINYH